MTNLIVDHDALCVIDHKGIAYPVKDIDMAYDVIRLGASVAQGIKRYNNMVELLNAEKTIVTFNGYIRFLDAYMVVVQDQMYIARTPSEAITAYLRLGGV